MPGSTGRGGRKHSALLGLIRVCARLGPRLPRRGVLLLAPDRPAGSELAGFLQRTESRVARLVGGSGVLGGAELRHLLLSAGLGGPHAEPMDIP